MNIDPTAKPVGADFDYEEERLRLERIKIQLELEKEDGQPHMLPLFGRQRNEGPCMCGGCDKRRLWMALRRVGKQELQVHSMGELDEFVQAAFKGETETVERLYAKYGALAVLHMGGPIVVTHCEICSAAASKDMCYHCGKQPWMRSRSDLKHARKDMKVMPRYIITYALHAAVMGSNIEMAEKLIQHGASMHLQDELGCTPLHWAACNGHLGPAKQMIATQIAEKLLKDGIDVTLEDLNGMTATELTTKPNPTFNAMRMTILKASQKLLCSKLLECCEAGDITATLRLIKAGADLAYGDWLNDTPFHVSAMYGRKELMDELIALAEKEQRLIYLLSLKTVDGLTPYDTALKWGYKELAAKLKSTETQKRVLELAEHMAMGDKIPENLRGTQLGAQLEKEMKRMNAVSKRMARMLKLENARAAKSGKSRAGARESGEGGGAAGDAKSQVCSIS
mmetsp:Transcript_14438/g.35329  ORF Transcript_14438/g.35329 Transcript_14438/m.35329 type:complete len:453 (-) Transcript_14438:501-1859(-)